VDANGCKQLDRQNVQHGTRAALSPAEGETFMTNRDLRTLAWMAIGVGFLFASGCSRSEQGKSTSVEASSTAPSSAATAGQKAEPQSPEAQSVEPQVQSEIENMEAQKRASLLADAQAALDQTRAALAALDKGDKQVALSALEQASGNWT
jgi:hypothetical protein